MTLSRRQPTTVLTLIVSTTCTTALKNVLMKGNSSLETRSTVYWLAG